MMRRREVITGLAGAVAWPVAARAASAPDVPRIGALSVGTIASSGHLIDAFLRGLSALGYVEEKSIVVIRRYAEGRLERLDRLAEELVSLKVDILFAPTSSAAVAAKKATGTIPIIFSLVTDPVGEGFVSSLRQPGGTITGMTSIAVDLAAKRLEILSELVPCERIGVVYFRAHPGVPLQFDEVQRAATTLNKTIFSVEAGHLDDLPVAFQNLVVRGVDVAHVIENPFYFANREKIVSLAAANKLPTIYNSREYVGSGGLVSYGASYSDLYRRAAAYVDKILKGTKPADLPVEQPTAFELVINLKAAKALGLEIPSTLLARAEEVIE